MTQTLHVIEMKLSWMKESKKFVYNTMAEAAKDTKAHLLTHSIIARMKYHGFEMDTHKCYTIKVKKEKQQDISFMTSLYQTKEMLPVFECAFG